MDPLDLVEITAGIEDLVSLLNVDHGDHEWKQKAHEYAKKIIIKLACQGRLDDYSMARLLQLPQTTSVGCGTLSYFSQVMFSDSHVDENSKTFSSTYGETMNTLLTLWQDDATSTETRIEVARAVLGVLNFESKDTILQVVSKFTELLVMDSNPTLQTHLARILTENGPATRAVIMIGEFTNILEVLMRLLVPGKGCNVRASAGLALNWFCQWKCTALKIAEIPGALNILFDIFLSNELPKTPFPQECKTRRRFCSAFYSRSFSAGYILGGLSCVEENRMKFCALKSGLDGLGNMLTWMQETWGSIVEEEQNEYEKQASIAAGILGELGLKKELRDHIGSLPGVEGALLFFQAIEMARLLTRDLRHVFNRLICASNTTRALAILYSNDSNPRSRDVPYLEQLQEVVFRDKSPPAEPSFVADLYQFRVDWTRIQAHIDMGAYKAALENLDTAQNYLDHILNPGYQRDIVLQTSTTWYQHEATCSSTPEALSSTRTFLQVMVEDHAGALLTANKRVEKAEGPPFCRALSPLIQRGIVNRVCRDLPGALHDLNAAYCEPSLANERYDILKHRGYVKHLMEDDVGAKEDAEAAEKLKFNRTVVEKTIDCRSFWDFQKLPIDYVGYFLSGVP